jgi:hypothetical protein
MSEHDRRAQAPQSAALPKAWDEGYRGAQRYYAVLFAVRACSIVTESRRRTFQTLSSKPANPEVGRSGMTPSEHTAVGFFYRGELDEFHQLRTRVANCLHDQFVGHSVSGE